MKQPKISVVTVCYNAVNDIGKTTLSDINLAQTFDGQPTLCAAVPSTRGRLHPLVPEGFCPLRGTEGVVKTIEERLGEKGRAFFNGKKRCQ